jgi:chromosome segregation ATPase
MEQYLTKLIKNEKVLLCMGLFDIFKRKKKAKETGEERLSPEKLVSLRERQSKEKHWEAIGKAKERILSLTKELDGEIAAIERVNLDDKKVEEKIRSIVKGNLESFLKQVKKLKQSLEELAESEFESIQGIASEADSLLKDFEKKSYMGFEKATYLVGKELGDVVKSISSFFKDMKKIVDNYKDLIHASDAIERIKSINEDIAGKQRAKAEMEKEIEDIEKKEKNSEKEHRGLTRQIEEIKKSNEYREKQEKKKELESRKGKLKQEVSVLKGLIDLKRLAGIFHSSEKQMAVIKELKDDFHAAFEKYKAEKILDMTSEAENKDEIRKKIEEISRLKQEIKEISGLISGKDEIAEIKARQEQLDTEKNLLAQDKEKLHKKKEQIIDDIKELEAEHRKKVRILRECSLK